MPQPPIKLLSSMATREVLFELTAQYQRATACPVATEAVGGVDVAKRVQAGEAVDVVVLSSGVIDKLIGEGKLRAGSRVDLARSGVAVAVAKGAPRPAIDSEAAVRRAVLEAKSLSYSTGPSGVYLEKLFERWGVLGQIRPRIVVAPPGVPVGSLVADGRAQLGFQQLSELKSLAGIDVLGPLPPEIQTITVFSGAIGTASRDADAARALLMYLAAPATAGVKQRHGLEPA